MPGKQSPNAPPRKGNKSKRKQPQPHAQAVSKGKQKAFRGLKAAFGQNASSPAQGATLARQMALPSNNEILFHMPTTDMPKAAITSLTTTHDARNASFATADDKCPSMTNTNGDLLILMYGQPGLSHMYGPVNHVAALGTGNMSFQYHGSHVDGQLALNSTTVQKGSSLTTPWQPVYAYSSLQQAARPLGVSGGRTYCWFDCTELFGFFFKTNGDNPTSLPVSFTIDLYQWQGPGEQPYRFKSMSYAKAGTPGNSYLVPVSGWYTFDFTISALDTDTFTSEMFSVAVVSTTNMADAPIMHLMYQEEIINSSIGSSIRRTGASILVTNTSAEVSKQGSIIAARLLNDSIWDTTSAMTTTHLAKAADKYTGQAANGLYTYMDFDRAAEDFGQGHYDATPGNPASHDISANITATKAGPVFSLDYYGYVHFIRITNPSPSTLPNDFLVTYSAVYEFRTDSMMYPRSVPTMDFHSLVEARRVNNSTMYFYENPLHLGDIWSHIKRAFNVVRRGAMPLGIAASAMFPEFSGIIMPIARAIQS